MAASHFPSGQGTLYHVFPETMGACFQQMASIRHMHIPIHSSRINVGLAAAAVVVTSSNSVRSVPALSYTSTDKDDLHVGVCRACGRGAQLL